jgi:ankyrin repeat protein
LTADAFVLAATGGRPGRAQAYLEATPELLADPWARLVAGQGWDGDVNRRGGPRGWPPVMYVAHSALAGVEALRDLLANGADPNDGAENEYGPISPLYGAAGVVRDPEKTRVLLEAGAEPDDGESLYHSTETGDTACLRLLLEHGATTECTNALAHALDYEPLEPVRLLLDAGADPDLIAHAVRRGRGADVVRLLAERGGDVNRPGGETWRGDVPLRTPYQHAVLRSRDDVAEALRDLGADTTVSPEDLAVAALDRSALPAAFDVDQQEVLILAALRGRLDAVVDAVGVGFAGVVGGSPEGTLLHHAAWVGSPQLVRALLDRGADPRGVLGWTAHGSQYHELPGRDYVAVAELLMAAGDRPTAEDAQAADGPLHDWLSERV